MGDSPAPQFVTYNLTVAGHLSYFRIRFPGSDNQIFFRGISMFLTSDVQMFQRYTHDHCIGFVQSAQLNTETDKLYFSEANLRENYPGSKTWVASQKWVARKSKMGREVFDG